MYIAGQLHINYSTLIWRIVAPEASEEAGRLYEMVMFVF